MKASQTRYTHGDDDTHFYTFNVHDDQFRTCILVKVFRKEDPQDSIVQNNTARPNVDEAWVAQHYGSFALTKDKKRIQLFKNYAQATKFVDDIISRLCLAPYTPGKEKEKKS